MEFTLQTERDAALYLKASEWNFDSPPANHSLIEHELARLLDEENGIGFSANQMGFLYRVFAMRTNRNQPVRFFYNPRIIGSSDEISVYEEGCLSFPGLTFKVKRPSSVKVSYQDSSGEIRTEDFSGIEARCFQHELDHLDGICFIDRASKLTVAIARKKLAKRERKR